MARRRLLILGVLLFSAVGVGFSINYFTGQPPAERFASQPAAITSEKSLPVFPTAVRVNLIIRGYDKKRGSYSLDPDGVDLSNAQRAEFERAIRQVAVAELGDACFVPHHFFRYFDSKGKMIGQIAICFCCSGGQAYPKLPRHGILEFDVDAIERLVKKMKLPTDVDC